MGFVMPARSRRQQKWAFAVKGPAWARRHHFDRVVKKRKSRSRRKRRK